MFPNLRARFLALMLVMLTLPACGIVISADFEGTEVFRDFELEGDFVEGSPVMAVLNTVQPYPLPLAVSCRYENTELSDDQRKVIFGERATPVYDTVLEVDPNHDIGDDPDEAREVEHRFEFTVSEAGEYFIACFTLAAPEHGIGERFEIESR